VIHTIASEGIILGRRGEAIRAPLSRTNSTITIDVAESQELHYRIVLF
jgi:hypothetical protein